MTNEDDILINLNSEELYELREKYRENGHYEIYILINMAIRWKQISDDPKMVVSSPNNTWRIDGSIVVFFYIMNDAVYCYSFDKEYTNIKAGLKETKRFHEGRCLFMNLEKSCVPVVLDFIQSKNWATNYASENFLFQIDVNNAKEFNVECPAEVYMKKLDKSYASRLNNEWAHKRSNSEYLVGICIEYNAAFGLFLKENDHLVSWAIYGILGHINMLHTDEKYRKKGYGEIVLKKISKYIAEVDGNVPLALVLVNNTASLNLFKKLGFKCIRMSYYIGAHDM